MLLCLRSLKTFKVEVVMDHSINDLYNMAMQQFYSDALPVAGSVLSRDDDDDFGDDDDWDDDVIDWGDDDDVNQY